MVNREARHAAIRMLQKLAAAQLTNYELEDNWPPRSSDRIVDELPDILWCNYDDTPEKVLTTADFGETGADFVKRIILFLKSDYEYEWPEWNSPSFRTFFRRLFGRQTAAQERESFGRHGDFTVWPFIRKEDFQECARRFESAAGH